MKVRSAIHRDFVKVGLLSSEDGKLYDQLFFDTFWILFQGAVIVELVKLTTEESKSGTFIHESLQLLFVMIYNGFPPGTGQQLAIDNNPEHHIFWVPPLRSHLFDPARTPILNRVKFRNQVLQRVINLMSLSRPKNRRDRRGRISYAQLGINQLGAVYEALLS